MLSQFFFKGFVIGFLIAAPVGPIGILCIRRSLAKGTLSGLFTGLGAATADAFYGAIGVFGLTFISGFLADQRLLLHILGIVFLLYLAQSIARSTIPGAGSAQIPTGGLLKDYISTVALTLTNPTTIVTVAAFTGVGLTTASTYTIASLVVLGVFTGSTTWFLLLSCFVGFFRTSIKPVHLRWVNGIAALLIVAFAIALTVSLVRDL